MKAAPDRLAIEIARGLAGTADGGEALLAEVTAGRLLATIAEGRHRRAKARCGEAARVWPIAWRSLRLTCRRPMHDHRSWSTRDAPASAKRRLMPPLAAWSFNKICAACHQLGGQGAKIGPGLDGVGLRGLDRLVEDTLDPSRNVDQAFRTTLINTTGGNVVTGLLLREEGEVLVLADAQGKEVRLPRNEVEERSVSKLSPMPANVADLIPEGDYYNLLGFLLGTKAESGSSGRRGDE